MSRINTSPERATPGGNRPLRAYDSDGLLHPLVYFQRAYGFRLDEIMTNYEVHGRDCIRQMFSIMYGGVEKSGVLGVSCRTKRITAHFTDEAKPPIVVDGLNRAAAVLKISPNTITKHARAGSVFRGMIFSITDLLPKQ